MYRFMAYNKDRDIYDELTAFDDIQTAESNIENYRTMLRKDELKDATGESYDWIEVWDDKDNNRADDLIITR